MTDFFVAAVFNAVVTLVVLAIAVAVFKVIGRD